MATYYWRSAVNNVWTSNNWSTTDGGLLSGTYPQTGDTAIFKASSGQGNCGLDANVSITKLDMRSDYTGTLSGNTYNFTTTGDMIIAGTQIIVGSGTWTTAGHLNYVNVGTFTPNTSKFIMTGTGKTLTISAANQYLYDLEINGTISVVGPLLWHNALTIKTNKSLTLTNTAAGNYNLGTTRISKLYLESGADFNLGGYQLNWYTPGTGGVQSMAATARIRNGTIQCLYPATSTGVGVWDFGATYGWEAKFRLYGPSGTDGHFTFPNKVCKLGDWFRAEVRSWNPSSVLTLHAAGSSTDVQISGYFAIYSDAANTGSVNVDNTGVTGNKWTFNSHVYDWMQTANGASVSWTVNDESIEFVGSANQDYNWAHEIGNVVINNSGTGADLFLNLQTGAHLHCKDLTGTDGGIACNSQQVTVEGDCILDFDNLTTGGADWNLYGHFDWKDVTTWSIDSSQEFIMNGVDKYLLGTDTKDLPYLTIPAGKSAYIHASTSVAVDINSAATIAGTLTVDGTVDFRLYSANLTVETTGTVTGTSDVIFYLAGSNTGLILNGSYTYSPARTYFVSPGTTSLIPAGTYDGHVRVQTTSGVATWQPDTGTYDISGYLLFEAKEGATLNVDCRSSQPVFNVESYLYLWSGATSGALNVYCNHPTLDINWNIGGAWSYHYATNNWFKGSGTITFEGSNTHAIDFYDNEVENIVINKTGGTDISLNYELKCDSLTINSGDFDALTYDVTVGDLTLTGAGHIDWGDNTWEISGNISTTSHSGTWTGGGTTWNLSGSGKTWAQRNWVVIANTWIKPGASYNGSGVIIPVHGYGNTFTIDGTITGNSSFWCYYGETHLNSTGVFQAGYIVSYLARYGGGITTWDGDYDPSGGILYIRDWYTTGAMVPADYSAHDLEVRIYSQSHDGGMVFSSGTYTFHHLLFQAEYAGFLTAINTTNNPDMIIKGDLNSDVTLGTLTWTKGTGTITMDSTGDYVVEMGGLELENMVIDKNSSITLTADLDVTSLEISSGDFDAAGYDVTISSDALDISTSGTVDCGSGDWTCWGDVIIDGIGTYNIDTADFYLKGTSKGIATATDYWNFENLYITGSYTANGLGTADNVGVTGIFDITGTFTTGNTDAGGLTLAVNTDLRIQTGGTLTGGGATTGEIRWYSPEVGITVLNGTWSNWITQIYYPNTAANWVPGTYDCRIEWVTSPDVACVVNFDAGTYNFTGGLVQFRVGISGNIHDEDLTVNLDASTIFNTSNDTAFGFFMNESTSTGDLYFNCNNANFNFSGDVFLSDTSTGSDLIYTKGTGTITFEGNVNQSVNMPYSLEDIVVNKSTNTVDFVSAITCETYTLTSGGADFNDDATTGVVSITGGTQSMTGTNKTWTCPSFTVNAGVSATVDVNDNNVTITGTGDLSFLANCNISFGSRTWTCNGDFFATGDTVVFTRDTSTLRLTGTGNFTSTGSLSTKYLYSIEIPVSAVRTVLAGSDMCSYNTVGTGASLDVDGTLTLNGGGRAFYHSKINLNTGGIINGSSFLQCYVSNNGGGLTTLDGTLTPGTFYLDYPTATAICVSGTYDCTVYVRCNDSSNSVWQLSAGTYIYNYSVYYQATDAAGSLTINGSVNNPDHVYKQHVVWTNTGDVFWTAGTGTITFDDTGDYEIDFGDELIEDVHIEKDSSGKITLRNDNFSAGSLTITTGKFDANDHDVTLIGDFLMTAGTGTEVWAGSGTWDVSGDFNNLAVTTNLFHAETSEIQLTGSGTIQCCCTGWINDFHKLTISGTYTMPETSKHITIYEGSNGWLKVTSTGTLNINDTAHDIYIRGNNDLIVESGGEIAIAESGLLRIFEPLGTHGITQNDGQITGDGIVLIYSPLSTTTIDDGIYPNVFVSGLITTTPKLNAGTFTINGSLKVRADGAGDITLDLGTNSPTVDVSSHVILETSSTGLAAITRAGATTNWYIGGDFDLQGGGPHSYTKGAAGAIITINGSTTQELEFTAGAIEDLVINKTGNANLQGNMTCETITGTSGNLDANGYDVNSEDVDWNSGLLNMDSGTWTCSGNFDVDDANVTMLGDYATLVMTGSNKNLKWRYYELLDTLDIDTGASITWSIDAEGNYGFVNDLIIDGTFKFGNTEQIVLNKTININATGIFGDGNGNLWMRGTALGHGLQTFDGPFNINTLYVHQQSGAATDQLALAGTYTCTGAIYFYASSSFNIVTKLGAGAYVFDTPIVYLRSNLAGTSTVDNTNNADITFNGSLVSEINGTGDTFWLKGTGLLTFAGSSSHNIGFDVGVIEDVEVDCLGTYTLTDNFDTESFLLTAGEIDFNGQTVQTTGDFTINAANGTDATIVSNADAMNAANITVGNDFYVSNITFNATDTWYLDVQGANAHAYDVSVRYSDANAGTTIDATAPGNTDLGVNYNWDFGQLPSEAVSSIHSLSFHCFPWTRHTNRHVRGNRRI